LIIDVSFFLESECELLANIHQIKLYFHYILADEFNNARIPTPAKLDVRCAHLAFDEMRRDGFADDGLFDQMKAFFLPLTMIEQDLSIDNLRSKSVSKNRLKERNDLRDEKQRLTDELSVKEDDYYRHDDAIKSLKQNKHTKKEVPIDKNENKYGEFSIPELIEGHRKDMNRLEKVRNDLRTQIQATEDLMNNIEQ
jgi:hypothetical protein